MNMNFSFFKKTKTASRRLAKIPSTYYGILLLVFLIIIFLLFPLQRVDKKEVISRHPIGGLLLEWASKNTKATGDMPANWSFGGDISKGKNPYSKIEKIGDIRKNHKYPTLLPGFYLLSAGVRLLGYDKYSDYMSFWRPILIFFYFGIAFLLSTFLFRQGQFIIGFLAAFFWLFNRWSLYIVRWGDIPSVLAIFFFVLSLVLLKKRQNLSLFALSISLAIKHMAIIAVPLYLIWLYRKWSSKHARRLLLGIFIIISVPLVVSLPFIIDSPKAFIQSILFSATRASAGHINAYSVDAILKVVGLPAKVVMVLLFVAVYIAMYRRKVSVFMAIFMVLAVFASFNSVIFLQYFAWLVPPALLVIADRDTRIISKNNK